MAKYAYILLSRTQTRFARAIRKVAKQRYNHVSISLDSGFRHLYAFARPQHNAVLLGRLVEESLERYTLGTDFPVPVMVYQIPVSEKHYEWMKQKLEEMVNDPKYMYNLVSVLSFPLIKGFAMDNTYTCVEFVAYLLRHGGYFKGIHLAGMKPDDMAELLKNYPHRSGDARDFLPADVSSENYFSPFSADIMCKSVKAVCKLAKRTCAKIANLKL